MHLQTSSQPVVDLGFHNCSCNWGTHLCGLYESEKERDDIILGFLGRGDQANDLGLYCPTERTLASFSELFKSRYPESENHLDDPDRFRFLDARTLYYPNGSFSPPEMISGLDRFFADTQKEGPRNIRGVVDMIWSQESKTPGVEHLMAYEAKLNRFIPGKPWVSLCLYDVNKFSGSVIMSVLQTHPYTISGGVVTENPFYQEPDRWLENNAPEFL
ncbi:MAG: MEDS domain-containing protein [Magnetococcales bacterium]|nr:MEDS domain-containing protein [Magnetococcales bacterium]